MNAITTIVVGTETAHSCQICGLIAREDREMGESDCVTSMIKGVPYTEQTTEKGRNNWAI
jgi:hypothetical protein